MLLQEVPLCVGQSRVFGNYLEDFQQTVLLITQSMKPLDASLVVTKINKLNNLIMDDSKSKI